MQATLRFPGVQQVLRWSYVLSQGITPGVCTVDIVPQLAVPDQVGTLRIAFGPVRITLTECVVDFALVRRGPDGMVVGLTLLDRRWKWRYGTISGRYNLRSRAGVLDRDTEQTPQELATRLLRAMGESGFSVADMPNDARPEIDWVAANPAGELAALCESLGCRVVLGVEGLVSICPIGVGATLPQLASVRTARFGLMPPARPDLLSLLAGPTRFQTQFRLEAVGEETDGTIVPIDELSYRPDGGWGFEPVPLPNVADADDRARARRSVYRWYRIKCTAGDEVRDTFRLPGNHGPVRGLWQLLPLERNLVETERDAEGIERPLRPFVEGIFWTGSPDGDNVSASRRYDGPFTLDPARGVVRFARPVLKRSADDSLLPAELYLTVAHPLLDADSRQELRYSLDRRLPGPLLGTGAHVLRRDDLAEKIVSAYSDNHIPTGFTTNHGPLEREAIGTLDAAQAEFQTLVTADAEYAGIVPISPDGAIRQVAWTCGPRGALTRASRNQEFSLAVPTWKERRAAEANRVVAESTRRAARAQWRLEREER
jgi:hypothetical protein